MTFSKEKLRVPPIVLEHVETVQRQVFHDQTEVLPQTLEPQEILKMRRGKCGEASRALSFLLDSSGIENRIVKMMKHMVVEARWDKGWHLLDTDMFKHGVVPARDDGTIPPLREVQGGYFMDRFPPTMYVYTREYSYYASKPATLLRPPYFYEPHEAGFISHYYQMNLGLPLEYPPSRPTGLVSNIGSGKVDLRWCPSQDLDNDLVGYEVMIGRRSRGWNYADPRYENVPRDTSETPTFTEYHGCEVKVDKGRYYWSVRAVDEHQRKEPRTYYFPSNESEFIVD